MSAVTLNVLDQMLHRWCFLHSSRVFYLAFFPVTLLQITAQKIEEFKFFTSSRHGTYHRHQGVDKYQTFIIIVIIFQKRFMNSSNIFQVVNDRLAS